MGAGPAVDAPYVDDADDAEDLSYPPFFDEDTEDDAASASASSAQVPDDAVIAKWTSLPPLAPSASGPVKAAAKRRVQKWSGGPDSPFSLPRPDPCLFGSFEAFRKSSKASWDSASALSSTSGSIGHAVLNATAGIERMKAYMSSQIKDEASEDFWEPFITGLSQILAPLEDAAYMAANAYASGVATIRKGVVAANAPPVRSLLESYPPKKGYFFGDPAKAMSSAVHLQWMTAQLNQASAGPRRLPFAPARRGSSRSTARPAAQPRPAAPSSAASSSSGNKGNAAGRPARGGKGGARK